MTVKKFAEKVWACFFCCVMLSLVGYMAYDYFSWKPQHHFEYITTDELQELSKLQLKMYNNTATATEVNRFIDLSIQDFLDSERTMGRKVAYERKFSQ